MAQSNVDARHQVLNSITDAIGNTPCVRLNRVPHNHGIQCEIVAKCEFLNPGGSVKDRIARQMIDSAADKGTLKPGSMLVEASSGNTGIGLALVSAVKGYDLTITMPWKMSHEKEVTIKALGAKVIRTETALPHDHPDSLIGIAKTMASEKGYVMLDQYSNEANIEAHYAHTAQEIYDQCGGRIDMVVASAGTGGTITGVAKRLKELLPDIVVVGVDPVGSILADPSKPESGSYKVEGIGYDFVPDVCRRHYVDRWVKSEDKPSFELARELHRQEGMLVGGSSGAALYGALQAAKDLRPDQRCVVIMPDNIRNYLAKFADDNWMIEEGFMNGRIERPTYDSLSREVAQLRQRVSELEAQQSK